MSQPLAASIKGVTKYYALSKVLDNVSFDVFKGQSLAVLGPNGSGKSTLFRLMLGLEYKYEGSITVLGSSDPEVYRHQMAIALDDHMFDTGLTGQANLERTAILRGVGAEAYMPLVKQFELERAINKQVGKYSLGMKKRLSLIACLMRNADFYLFDEPMNGLDVPGMYQVREILNQLRADGKTILMSSHLMEDVERVSTHIALMYMGHLIEYGTMADVRGTFDNLGEAFMAKTRNKEATS